jgi:hypothetical protein
MKRRRLHRRYGRSGARKFVEYLIHVDGKKLETPIGAWRGAPSRPTFFRSRKAAIEKAKELRAAGHVVEVQRRTHSATESYKRVNIKVR